MMEFIQNFHFLRPWFLLFLLLPIGLYFKQFKYFNTLSSWQDICDKNLLSYLLIKNSNLRKVSIQRFVYIALTTAAFSAAGPTWKKVEIPSFTIENPNMFIISLAQDMQLRDVPPSRLDRAKFMLSDITENLSQGQFGIEVYSQEPYIITPFTDDITLIKNLLPQITPTIVPDQGDRLDRALDLAFERFKTSGFSSGNIILFASDVGQRFDLALEKTKQAASQNYSVYVVDTSFTGSEKLQLLAETGNGVYVNVQDTNPTKLLQKLNDINNERVKVSENLRSNYIDFGYYLLFIPLICVLFFFRKGFLVLFLCFFALQANAAFLQNSNQEGLALYNKQQYDEALKKFDDTNWRGVTLYKQEKLEDALKEFEKKDDELSFYNRGVILTKLCKYHEALEAFEKSLQLNPTNEDAKYNQQVLTDIFARAKDDPSVLNCQDNQQQNQSQNDDKQDDNENSGNQDNSSSDQQQNNDENSEQQQSEDNGKNEQQNNSESDNGNNQQQEINQQMNNEENNKDNSQQGSDNNANQDISDRNSQADNSSQNDKNTLSQDSSSNDNESSDGQPNSSTEQKQNVPLANAQKGDDDERYDEEALALQRQYREIPEDIGGLLREFIKKEYMKGRYNGEKM